MSITHTILPCTACRVECSQFSSVSSPIEHFCLQLNVTKKRDSFVQQLDSLLKAWGSFVAQHPQARAIFTRVFLSDSNNQECITRAAMPKDCGALSVIEQSPLDGSKISILVYLQTNVECSYLEGGAITYKEEGLEHLWTASARLNEGNSHEQCEQLFEQYSAHLEQAGGDLFHNSIRTWLFVQNVDANYAGVVTGRNAHFDVKNLTEKTHYISSTGIQGRSKDIRSLVQMDTYSILGVRDEQIQFLHALDHLNPTHEYGVRFERGTAVHFKDRTQCFISGTASIDNKGNVLHVGDIKSQCLRMWENVDALLSEAGASMNDSLHMIVYLRDIADYEIIEEMFTQRFPHIPRVIVLAPVCRPAWLIEMECITITQTQP